MMSRTMRVFKLMYIVAGILMSNEEICDTVDRIQIAPRVEVKPEIEASYKAKQQRSLSASNASSAELSTSKRSTRRRLSLAGLASGLVRHVTGRVVGRFGWLRKYDLRFALQQWRTLAYGFNMWTIPNYLLEYTSSYISKKFFINSDCDMIYK